MSFSITRRKLLMGSLTAAAGASGLAIGGSLARRFGLMPPSYHNPFALGEILSFTSQRLLMSRHPLVREFGVADISKVAPLKGRPPEDDDYLRLAHASFGEWRLGLDGLVLRPGSFSLAELTRFPMTSQTTLHACEEGWSFIAQWTGVSLPWLLSRAGVAANAKYVVFYCHDGWWGSIDMDDVWHPQTLLALAMNGKELSIEHGAPLRLRVARQMGYKSFKYISHLSVVDSLKNVGNGLPDFSGKRGYSWYAGM